MEAQHTEPGFDPKTTENRGYTILGAFVIES